MTKILPGIRLTTGLCFAVFLFLCEKSSGQGNLPLKIYRWGYANSVSASTTLDSNTTSASLPEYSYVASTFSYTDSTGTHTVNATNNIDISAYVIDTTQTDSGRTFIRKGPSYICVADLQGINNISTLSFKVGSTANGGDLISRTFSFSTNVESGRIKYVLSNNKAYFIFPTAAVNTDVKHFTIEAKNNSGTTLASTTYALKN